MSDIMDALKFMYAPKTYYKENPTLLTKWAKKVYKKDNYTCVKCKYSAGGNLKLEAHHIFPKSKFPKMVFRVSNGVCLCEVCHRTSKDSYHALNGNKGNRKMFNKWLKNTTKTDKEKKNDLLNKLILTTLIIAATLVVGVIFILTFKGI